MRNASTTPCANDSVALFARTLSFSKCDRMHEVAVRLFIHPYNQQPITY